MGDRTFNLKWTYWIALGLSIAGVGGCVLVFLSLRPAYEYGHSQGTFWRVDHATGIRETSTRNGWRTDSDLKLR